VCEAKEVTEISEADAASTSLQAGDVAPFGKVELGQEQHVK
jgi:hypothetical protein